jgi:hypothetical protein
LVKEEYKFFGLIDVTDDVNPEKLTDAILGWF